MELDEFGGVIQEFDEFGGIIDPPKVIPYSLTKDDGDFERNAAAFRGVETNSPFYRKTDGSSVSDQLEASALDIAGGIGNIFSKGALMQAQSGDDRENFESGRPTRRMTPESINSFNASDHFPSAMQEKQALQPTTPFQQTVRNYGGGFVAGSGVGGLMTRGLGTTAKLAEQASNALSVGGAMAGEKIAPDNAFAPFIGSVTGALTPYGLAATGRGLMRGVGKNAAGFRDNVNIFQTANTTPTLPQAAEGTIRSAITRMIGAGLDKMPIGNQMWLRRFGQQNDEVRDGVRSMLDVIAADRTPGTTGRIIKNRLKEEGVNVPRSKAYIDVELKYDALSELVPTSTEGSFGRTINHLENVALPVSGMDDTSDFLGGESLKKVQELLKKLKSDTGDTGVATYQQIKETRTLIGRELERLKFSPDDAAIKPFREVYGTLTEDMRDIVRSTNDPRAMTLWEDANQTYTRYRTEEADFLNKLQRKVEFEDVFNATTGNKAPEATKAIYGRLTARERQFVSAAQAERMGHATSRYQDDVGDMFSTETFLTRWNSLNKSVRETMYPEAVYGSLRSDMDVVAKTAAQIRKSAQGATNASGSSQGAAGVAFLGALFLDATRVGTALLGSGIAITSELMTNPKFINWLAESTKVPLTSAPGYLARFTAEVAPHLSHEELEQADVFLENVNGVFSDAGVSGFVGARGGEQSNPLGAQQ